MTATSAPPLTPVARASRSIVISAGFAIAIASCGDRTGLLASESSTTTSNDDAGVTTKSHACPYTSGVENGAAWPMIGHCSDHADLGNTVGPSTTNIAWSVSVDTNIGSPIIDALGSVYLCAGSSLYTIAAGTRAVSSLTRGASCTGVALSYDGMLYAVFADGVVIAIPANDSAGAPVWQLQLPIANEPSAPTIGPDGTIYVAAFLSLFAISPSGALVFDATYPINSSSGAGAAVSSDGTIYVSLSGESNIVAYDPSGNQKWAFKVGDVDARYSIGADLFQPPTVGADGTIYAITGQEDLMSTVFAIDPSGTMTWTADFGGFRGDVSNAAPAIAPDGSIVFVNFQGVVASFLPDGAPKWTFILPDDAGFAGPAMDSAGTLYIGTRGNALIAVTNDGKKKWTATLNDQASAPAIADDGTLVVATIDGTLQGIGP